MKAEIIGVGTELLLGQIANTNAQYLSGELAEIGVNVYFHTVVGDNPSRLADAIKQAEKRADLLIFTGGLGPTKDDLTKEIIAGHLQREMETDNDAWEKIQDYFKRTGRYMTANNEKQARVIKGAKVLPNEHGMAPGMFIKEGPCFYMLLPGPPHEMKPMFRTYGRQAIIDQLETVDCIESRVLRFFNIGEAEIAERLSDIIDAQTNPTVAPLAGDGEVTIRLTARSDSKDKAVAMLNDIEKQIQEKAGEHFYGYNDTSLMAELLKVLENRELTIAAAESLTGGLFQSEMTSVVGVSTMLLGGIVCYSNEAKVKLCDVKPETLEKHGAVSEQCAIELAENVRMSLNADIGISFTGAAGPDSLEGHPAGTVWIGMSFKDRESKAILVKMAGTRNGNRRRSVKMGCYYLLKELDKK
ncbi:competence/damage-inducible protein A [Siminovitchia fortis]|uniref:competence/damage-inducible protein A n=1 Tax=Siminovitchia fortis TaxID=254758 RepID=UPI0011A84C5F|nr:competence/damage-inducible protein A [Siminovitchia fortis]